MKRWIKRIALGVLALVVVTAAVVGIYAGVQASRFDASMDQVYDVPLPTAQRSTDPEVIARGKHLAQGIAGCTTKDCHGQDLGGGSLMEMGPLGTLQAPNITSKGMGAVYSDAEFARLIKHGIKKDGRSATLMPSQDFVWMRDSDVVAIVSYLRSVPPVERPNGPVQVKLLGKVLDRREAIPLAIARRIDHGQNLQITPEPTAAFGKYLAQGCKGCHGERMSGGPIPGAPSNVPTPLNLTPHESGLRDWTFADFQKFFRTSVRKNGKTINPFMPMDNYSRMDDLELTAIWEYLRTVPPLGLGNR